jgi:hypothetical protein
MAKRVPGKLKAELAAWIGRERPSEIGEREWKELQRLLAPASETYLRRLLRESGVPLAPIVEGVRQESFQALESSLMKLLHEYTTGDRARQVAVRRLVIEARAHARWASRREDRRVEKQEMMLWMLTWLENPPLFPKWARLRRAAMGQG